MHKEKIKELDLYVQNNFKKIKRSANTLCKSYSNDDVDEIINNSYLKFRDKIERDGFKGNNYGGYLWSIIRNEYRMKIRELGKNKEIFILDMVDPNDELKNQYLLDIILLEENEKYISHKQYQNDVMDISKDLFLFIKERFNEKEVYLFKDYFLTPLSTYRKLSQRTDFSISQCSVTIKGMKKDIKKNFIPWYKNKYKDE